MINYIIINTIISWILEWKVEIGIWKLEYGMVVFGFRSRTYIRRNPWIVPVTSLHKIWILRKLSIISENASSNSGMDEYRIE